jgi:transcriptional regulator with XRE-family HTH domain
MHMKLNTYALREWRKVRGLSISQLASDVPMPQPNMSKIQLGTEQPSHARLIRIAEVLGVDPEALVGPDSLDLAEWPFVRGKKRAA